MNPFRALALSLAVLVTVPLLVGIGATVGPVEKASAVTGAGFDPSNIIDDALFFNGAAMSAAQVQSFLDSKGGAIKGVNLRTPSMNAESGLCSAYSGAASERVSDVIAKIGAACGISQKVLLVLLQKEQHLVSATNPSQWTLDHATGFACPDTAPCDAGYAGFFYQVWYAARQFKLYVLHPTWYNHIAGRVNNVRYHPNAGCGTSPVFIQNLATAGLYNYTPYQPNDAAIYNVYGTGDGCSSYGNRNFWGIYTDWFGSTTSFSAIITLHAQLGGNSGILGRPTGGVETIGIGKGQRFENGSVFWSSAGGAWPVMAGPIRDAYFAAGAPFGSYGWPLAAQSCAAGVCSQRFTGGTIVDVIAALYAQMGGASGSLGPIQGPVESIGSGSGQRFKNGSIFSSAAGTFAVMSGRIRDEYFARGGPTGSLGWPTAQQVCVSGECSQTFENGTIANPITTLYTSMGGASGPLGAAQAAVEVITAPLVGTGQRFKNGSIFSSTAGTFAVMAGAIRDEYFARGGPAGALGWPTAAEACTGGVCSQAFQGGTISNQIGALHQSLGGDSGVLGKAQAGIENINGGPNGNGTGQRFKNGSIFSSTAGTFAVMAGAIRDEYFARGGPAGALGWPTAAEACTGGVCSQAFQGGTISNQIGALHQSLGGDSGVLGKAQAGIENINGGPNGNGTGQRFTNGSIFSSTAGTFSMMNGTIRDKYLAQGGPAGPLGWPSSERTCTGSACTQSFQNGTLTSP